MRESKVENNIVKLAKSLGYECYKFKSPGRKGVPDRMFLKSGRAIFLEIKRPGEKARALQEEELQLIRDQGFIAEAVDSVEEAIRYLS